MSQQTQILPNTQSVTYENYLMCINTSNRISVNQNEYLDNQSNVLPVSHKNTLCCEDMLNTNKRSKEMEIVESYYENGNAKEFIITKDGNHIGDGDYNESGEKHEIIWETENGNTIHRYYGKNGKLEKLEEIESISDDEFIETVRYFNQDETSYLELNFKNELLVGAGQKIQEEEYQNDEIISVVGFTSNVTGLNDEEDTKND